MPQGRSKSPDVGWVLFERWSDSGSRRDCAQSSQTQLVEVSSEDIKEFHAMAGQRGAREMALEKYRDK